MTLTVERGSFAYGGRDARPVLRDISFSAQPGDLVAILGPNGAGKTTLLRCTMGFLRWRAGRSLLDGQDIRTLGQRQLWRSLAYVPQAKNAAIGYTVEEMVLLGCGSHYGLLSQPRQGDVDRVRAILDQLHLTKLLGERCDQISGGELQMVLIARALAAQPRILILDEPESNLDFKNQLLVLDTMSRLAADGMTCIFNTHYPAHALQRANRALLLDAAGNALFGETRRVVSPENIRRAFGVEAVIGQVETPGSIVQDVIPLRVQEDPAEALRAARGQTRRRIAVLAVITPDAERAGQINTLLHQYSRYIVGRMGMPYPDGGVHIINVTLDAPEDAVQALSDALGRVPGVSVKATYAQAGEEEKDDQP